jgi:hypothetical protein
MTHLQWLLELRLQEELNFRIGRTPTGYVAEWLGTAKLEASADGTNAHFRAAPEANALALRKLENESVPALLAHLQGTPFFHAACVAFPDQGAWLLLGPSGAGKSTLAADLCKHYGASMISDDVCRLTIDARGAWVEGRGDHHALCTDSANALGLHNGALLSDTKALFAHHDEKSFVNGSARVANTPVALYGILELDYTKEPPDTGRAPEANVWQRQVGARAVGALLPHVVRFALDATRAHLRDLDHCIAICKRVPVFRWARPHGLEKTVRAPATAALAQRLRATIEGIS